MTLISFWPSLSPDRPDLFASLSELSLQTPSWQNTFLRQPHKSVTIIRALETRSFETLWPYLLLILMVLFLCCANYHSSWNKKYVFINTTRTTLTAIKKNSVSLELSRDDKKKFCLAWYWRFWICQNIKYNCYSFVSTPSVTIFAQLSAGARENRPIG